MDGELSIGLDVHKNSITATVLDPLGHRVDQSSFVATDAEIVRYLSRFPGPKQVVLEACHVWEHCYDAATSTGARVLLASPLKTRLISEASLKSDKVDSEALAKLGRLGNVPEAFAPDAATRALRQLVRDPRRRTRWDRRSSRPPPPPTSTIPHRQWSLASKRSAPGSKMKATRGA